MRGCLVVLVLLCSCVAPSSVTCGDRICPAGSHCEPSGLCVTDEELVACADKADHDACSTTAGAGECLMGACIPSRCGDGIRIGTEQCDGDDLGGATCETQGFYMTGGTLSCNPQCQFDTNECLGGRCGDGTVLDGRESCEPDVSAPTTCSAIGYYETTSIDCTASCSWNTALCHERCGDNIVQASFGEACDGSPPATSCLTYRYDYGAVGCKLCAPEYSRCGSIGWIDDVPSPQGVTSISGTLDDLWTANNIVVSHRTGQQSWNEVTIPGGSPEGHVLARATNDVYVPGAASGGGAAIHHYDGSTWTTTLLPNGASDIATDITDVASGDLLAVTTAALYRFTGGTWSRVVAVSGGVRVWAASATDVYIVTNVSTLVHVSGTTPSTVTLPGSCVTPYDVWGTGSTNVFVACAGGIARYTGSWAMSLLTSAAMRTVRGGSASQVVAGGASGMFFWFDGTAWYDIPGLDSLAYTALWTDGTVVMGGVNSNLRRLERNGYQARTNEVPDLVPTDVWASGNDVYVATGDNLLHRTSNTPWTTAVPSGAGATEHLWGFAPNNFYVTDFINNKLWHYTGTWTSIADPHQPLAIWAAATNDIWVAGRGGTGPYTLYIDRWNGSSWSTSTSMADNGAAVMIRGTSASDVWMTRTDNTIWHFDGSTWTSTQLTGLPLTAVWAITPTNALAVADKTVYRWNGTTWSPEMTGATFPMLAVWARSATDIFIGGSFGQVLHYDGAAWNPMRSTRSNEAVLAIFGTADRVVFARDSVGGGDLLYQFAPWN